MTKIVVEPHGAYMYRLHWWFPEEDTGGAIGNGYHEGRQEPVRPHGCNDEEWNDIKECFVADRAAATTPGVKRDGGGFYWETENEARSALTTIRAALKSYADKEHVLKLLMLHELLDEAKDLGLLKP